MIVEERVYRIKPGKMPEMLKAYQEIGLEIQKEKLGNLIGYFQTEIGGLNSLVHLWGYSSLDDRQRRRSELAREPQWQRYLEVSTPLIDTMDNRILVPTDFSPIR